MQHCYKVYKLYAVFLHNSYQYRHGDESSFAIESSNVLHVYVQL